MDVELAVPMTAAAIAGFVGSIMMASSSLLDGIIIIPMPVVMGDTITL